MKSRDQLGKAGSKTLLQYYTSVFGVPGSPSFQKAQEAFTKSLAAYAIICYLMCIKVLECVYYHKSICILLILSPHPIPPIINIDET